MEALKALPVMTEACATTEIASEQP